MLTDQQTSTADEVKALWAYSELSSSRWRDAYATHLPAEIVTLADSRAPFSALPTDALPLIQSIRAVRIPDFVDSLDASPAYRLTGLSKRQLLRLWVIPLFSPGGLSAARYALFYAGKPLDEGDPRAMLARQRPGPYRQEHPVIVTAFQDGAKLIEGYYRSVLFMRDAPQDARLETLCPADLDLPA